MVSWLVGPGAPAWALRPACIAAPQITPKDMKALMYGVLNVTTTVGIVMANKAVMQT